VILVVPPYLTQAERKAHQLVAKMAEINLMQLINSPAAIGLNYGVFRRAEFNASEQLIMLYDMGAQSTVVSVLGFQSIKEKGKTEVPQLEVKSVAYDRTLGGAQWDMIVRDSLMQQFKESKKGSKTKADPAKSPRTLAKLLAAASKSKMVLSANLESLVQVEGLHEEIDFKGSMSRASLEDTAKPLLAKVAGVAERALQGAGLEASHLTNLIIMGGGTRVPAIQDVSACVAVNVHTLSPLPSHAEPPICGPHAQTLPTDTA